MSVINLGVVCVRSISVGLAWLMLFQSAANSVGAQVDTARKLRIVILEGEGAINNLKVGTAREPLVQVQDENDRPLGAAMVVFTLPEHGASGVFADGSKSLIVHTDAKGRAIARGLQPRNAGRFQIRVDASFQGLTASSSITQTNMMAVAAAATAGGISAKVLTILAVVGGAAAAGVVAATSGNGGGNDAPQPSPPPTISLGQPSVGAPPQ